MKVAVVGSGYVGLVTGACLAEIGHHVVCVDNDPVKIARLNTGAPTLYENFLPELMKRNWPERLSFSGSIAEAVSSSEVIFIAVATPPLKDGSPDLSAVSAVASDIAKYANGFKVVVQKSTVPVRSAEWLRSTLARMRPDIDFEIVSNPEFLREGTAVTDFLYAERVVVGCGSERGFSVMRRLYEPIVNGSYARRPGALHRPKGAPATSQLIETSCASAEMIKYAANSFLSAKISFINAIANLCENVGADIEEVAKGLGSDSRIGPQFLRAGLGYGGSCFPKDVAAFIALASQAGCDLGLLKEVARINVHQRQIFLEKVRKAMGTLQGKRVAVLGLAFKGGTDDIRCSPALDVVDALLEENCHVVAYDPAAMERVKPLIRRKEMSYAEDVYSACRNANAVLILTDWEEFASLNLNRVRELLADPVLVDGRNLYRPAEVAAHGLAYHSVGRSSATPEEAPEGVSPVMLVRATAEV